MIKQDRFDEEQFYVYRKDGTKVPAYFETKEDAEIYERQISRGFR